MCMQDYACWQCFGAYIFTQAHCKKHSGLNREREREIKLKNFVLQGL